jgi:soluble epoxide hydrolase / lipid-phosphate phosphatase
VHFHLGQFLLRLLSILQNANRFLLNCHNRGGASYSPPSPKPLDVDAVLAAIAPVLGYENIGYFKFFAADHAPGHIEQHVREGFSLLKHCIHCSNIDYLLCANVWAQLDSFLSIMFGPPENWKDHVCKRGGLESCLKVCSVYTFVQKFA